MYELPILDFHKLSIGITIDAMQTLYKDLATYFDVIAAASSVDTRKEVAFLENIFSEHSTHSVLDIACGTGRHSIALAEDRYDVTGVDYSSELLKVARSKADMPNLTFLQQDVANLKLDTQFDAAICMWSTFGELPYKQMLERLRLAVKSQGLFVIDGSYYESIPTEATHKTYTNEADGIKIVTEINESYKGITRTREIVNHIDGQVFRDHSEMDVLTESDYKKLLKYYGFEHLATYYDYVPDKPAKPKRMQVVFANS